MISRRDLIIRQKIREMLAERKDSEKIRTWIPHEKQEDFVRSKETLRALLGSNRCGKTESGIIEDISFAIGYRPYLKPNDPDFRTPFRPPVKIRLFGEDYVKQIGGVLVPKLIEWIPRSEFEYGSGNPKKNPQGIPVVWKFKNGSKLEILSYEQDVEKAEGWDGHVVHFDEPPSRKLFTACWRGLTDHYGWCWMTLTPLKEPWIYDEIVLKRDPAFGKYAKTFSISITDNLKHDRKWYGEIVRTGGLEQEAIDRFIAGVPEDEREARVHGRPVHLQGLVFKDFYPRLHIIEGFDVPRDWPRYEHIDVHPRKPWAIVFIAVAPDGTMYVYDELSVAGSYDDIIRGIITKRHDPVTKRETTPQVTLIDPLATQKDQMNETTVAEEIWKRSGKMICPIAAPKRKTAGFEEIHDALKPRERDEKCGLYIFSKCRNTVYEFGHLIWDKETEKPMKENDDFIEGVYRIFLINPKYEFKPTADSSPSRRIRPEFGRAIAY